MRRGLVESAVVGAAPFLGIATAAAGSVGGKTPDQATALVSEAVVRGAQLGLGVFAIVLVGLTLKSALDARARATT